MTSGSFSDVTVTDRTLDIILNQYQLTQNKKDLTELAIKNASK